MPTDRRDCFDRRCSWPKRIIEECSAVQLRVRSLAFNVRHHLMLTPVLVCDASTYRTSWVSSPDLFALKLQYLPIYKVFRCTPCMTTSNPKAPKGCIHPAKLDMHLLTLHTVNTVWRKFNDKLTTLSRPIFPMKSSCLLLPGYISLRQSLCPLSRCHI